MTKLWFVGTCLVFSVGSVACSKPTGEGIAEQTFHEPTETETTVAAGPAQQAVASNGNASREAEQLFDSTCAVCHGASGGGDGPGAAALNPKPRNFGNAEWQKSIDDETIKKTIVSGGMAVGKSPVMPATPQLKKQPEVLDALVQLIRGFGQQA